jgi:hypothetical protein
MSSAVTDKQPANGLIAYLGLSDWWFNSLSEEDRATIRRTYAPFGGCHLEDGEVQFSQFTPLSFLTGMAAWFVKDHLRLIACRILDKAATYVANASEPLDIHFFYGTRIEV